MRWAGLDLFNAMLGLFHYVYRALPWIGGWLSRLRCGVGWSYLGAGCRGCFTVDAQGAFGVCVVPGYSGCLGMALGIPHRHGGFCHTAYGLGRGWGITLYWWEGWGLVAWQLLQLLNSYFILDDGDSTTTILYYDD